MPQKSLDRLRFTVGTFEYVGLKVDQACGFLFAARVKWKCKNVLQTNCESCVRVQEDGMERISMLA
jgi:hypothetical protein